MWQRIRDSPQDYKTWSRANIMWCHTQALASVIYITKIPNTSASTGLSNREKKDMYDSNKPNPVFHLRNDKKIENFVAFVRCDILIPTGPIWFNLLEILISVVPKSWHRILAFFKSRANSHDIGRFPENILQVNPIDIQISTFVNFK